jgi:hypothetical protein
MAKSRDKQDDIEKRRRESRPTIQERVAMEKRNEEIRLRLKQSTDRANARELREGLPKTAKVPDKLSGRTPDAGTKSLLQGMKSFMRSSAKTAFKGVGRGGGGRHGTRL